MRITGMSEPGSRRRLLLGLLAAGLVPGQGHATSPGASRGSRRVREWDSGNEVLAPLSLHEGQVLFAGDRTIGRIDLKLSRPVWNVVHGLTGEAVYKPRAAGQFVLTGGLYELGAWRIDRGQRAWLHKANIQMGVPYVTSRSTYVGDGHELLAINNESGAVHWRHAGTVDTLSSYAPVLAEDTVFFGPGNGLLYALNKADGQEKWRLDRNQDWQYLRQLYVSQGVLVAGSYKELLYGISVVSGKVLWTFNAGNFINSHHVFEDTAYLWSPTGWVYAIDIHTGDVRWRHQTTNYGQTSSNWGPMMAELVARGAYVYALDMHNVLHLLSTANGQEVGRISFQQNLRPVVLPGNGAWAVVATEEGKIQQVRW